MNVFFLQRQRLEPLGLGIGLGLKKYGVQGDDMLMRGVEQ